MAFSELFTVILDPFQRAGNKNVLGCFTIVIYDNVDIKAHLQCTLSVGIV